MSIIAEVLTRDHARCDTLFADAEAAVANRNWGHAQGRFSALHRAMQMHFEAEEKLLFPAFEARTGMAGGPTAVMRSEHAQMNSVLDDMAAALAARDSSCYLGSSETLLVLMQQHNLKEENILYPMTDRALASEAGSLAAALKALLLPVD
jgi:iron-sulfur cluster repair protein YtfE (RIC family)